MYFEVHWYLCVNLRVYRLDFLFVCMVSDLVLNWYFWLPSWEFRFCCLCGAFWFYHCSTLWLVLLRGGCSASKVSLTLRLILLPGVLIRLPSLWFVKMIVKITFLHHRLSHFTWHLTIFWSSLINFSLELCLTDARWLSSPASWWDMALAFTSARESELLPETVVEYILFSFFRRSPCPAASYHGSFSGAVLRCRHGWQ